MRRLNGSLVCFTLSSLFLFVSCSEKPAAPPSTPVKVSPVKQQEYHATYEYVGRIEAVEDASIQAQVTGYLQSAHFVEGDIVEKDALLFVIDPSTYEAKLSAAKASVSQAAAMLEEAQLNYNRGAKLIKQGAISRSELDRLTAKLHSTQADMQTAKANRKAAAIDLQHTRIIAPFKGRIGEKKFSIGDLVKAGQQDPLTTLVSIDPIYATFQVNGQTYDKVTEFNRHQKEEGKPVMTFTAHLKLSTGDIYPHEGKLDFVANRVNADTDSIMIRAKFPNPEGILRPGQYVRVEVEADQPQQVLTLPQAAVMSNQEGDSVYVVDSAGKVKRVNVDLESNIGTDVIIESPDIKAGDKVITAGTQKVKPGQTVTIQPEKQIQATPTDSHIH